MLEGWGGPGLLGSYEIERRQVGERNVAASTYASRGRRAWRAEYRPCLRDNTPEGAAARAHLARFADREQRKSNEMIGAELGYRYVGSPIVWPEPGEGPPHEFIDYVPSTWPGARLPHVWLDDGTALHDRLGEVHLPGRPRDAVGVKALAITAQRAFDAFRPSGVKVHAGAPVIEKGMVEIEKALRALPKNLGGEINGAATKGHKGRVA